MGSWGATMPFIVLSLLSSVVIVVLLLVVVQVSFQEGGRISEGVRTLDNYRELFRDTLVLRALTNTFWFTIVVIITSVVLAVPLALLVERTDLPARGWVVSLLTLSLAVPSFFPAMGWQFLLHPRIGMINQWLIKVFSLSGAPFDIGSVVGMGFVQGLGFVPLAFIMVAPAFRNMDPSLEESAQIHGARLWDRMFKVTLPLMWPSILAAGLYIMALGITSFDVPAFLGMANRIYTLSTFLFIRAQPLDAAPNYGLVGALSVATMILGLLISWWYLRTIRQSDRYQVISGKAYRPQRIELGGWWIGAWLFAGTVLGLSMVLPLLTLVWVSLIPFLMFPTLTAFKMVSFENFHNLPWSTFWFALYNTAILTIAVPTITTVFGVALSWTIIKSKTRFAWAYDIISFLPHVIANLIFAVGALFIALFWLPPSVPFYGTIFILILVNVVTRIPFATRMYNSSLLQINKELDEAGYVSGLRPMGVMWNIVRPLLGPTLLYAWLWMALLAYRELTMAALLVTKDNSTLPVYIWAIWNDGELNQAAAVSLLALIAVVPLVALYYTLGRRTALWQGS
jgi:iron(III) transport system permease protein